jgi:hypothetical protein
MGQCPKRYSLEVAQPYIVVAVTWCAYCGQPATVDIPSNPGRVCLTHALEFWTGLLAYVRDRSGPCERREKAYACGSCDEPSALKARKVPAVAAAGPQPGVTESVPTRPRLVTPIRRTRRERRLSASSSDHAAPDAQPVPLI